MGAIAVLLGILLLGTLVYYLFRDPMSFLMFAVLIGILMFVLLWFGFVSFETMPNQLDINYNPTPAVQNGTANGIPPPSIPVPLEEVFYVANNIFTYDQAPAVCSAYGAEVASYSQVEDAYARGGEWCGYGWTQGGIALFPTQEETWRKLQLEVDPTKRVACGRPGINGGYFEPSTKFGVNCYGVRPKQRPGSNDVDKDFAASVDRLKGMIDKLSVYPFKPKDWSEYTNVSRSIVTAEANIKGLGSQIQEGVSSVGSASGDIASGLGEATGATIVGLGDLGESLVKNIVVGLGNFGSSVFDGFKTGINR